MTQGPIDVLVVGGGIAGLVAAHRLTRSGRRVLLVEAGEEYGGCVSRHTVDGIALDAGADSFATASPAVTDLTAELGMADRIVAPASPGAWVRHEHGAAPLPAGALLGIPARPLAADTRRVLGPVGTIRAAADSLLPRRVGADRSTLGGLVRARMGNVVVRRLVEPVAGGVYSADPDDLELAVVSPRLAGTLRDKGSLAVAVQTLRAASARPGALVAGLRGGMFTLVEGLAGAVEAGGGTLRVNSRVDALHRVAGGFVATIAGYSSPLQVPAVVLAVPGRPAALLLAGCGLPAGPPTETGEVLLATLVVDSPSLDIAPRGTGVLVSRHVSGITAKALTHATAKWSWLAEAAGPGRHVLRLSYGRGDSLLPKARDFPGLALRDAGQLLGVELAESRLTGFDLVRWTAALPLPRVGQRAAVERLRAGLPAGLSITGSFLAGTGLAAVVTDATTTATATARYLDSLAEGRRVVRIPPAPERSPTVGQ